MRNYTEVLKEVCYFIAYDYLKVTPEQYIYRVSSLVLDNDVITERPLARQTVNYEGEDHSEHTISMDSNGNELTEDEYADYSDTYYGNLGASKHTAHFKWVNVADIDGISDSAAVEMLTETYENFVYN